MKDKTPEEMSQEDSYDKLLRLCPEVRDIEDIEVNDDEVNKIINNYDASQHTTPAKEPLHLTPLQ